MPRIAPLVSTTLTVTRAEVPEGPANLRAGLISDGDRLFNQRFYLFSGEAFAATPPG